MHPRRIRLYLLVLLLILALVAGCSDRPPASPTPPPTPGEGGTVGGGSTGQIRALGTVRPVQTLQLGFLTGGPVRAVGVGIGDHVQAGDLLAELDTTGLAWAVREAEEALGQSQALLAQAQTGPGEAGVALAQAELDGALAQHEDLLAGPSRQAIAMAQADVDAARVRYEQVRAGASPPQLLAAQADLEKAKAVVAAAQVAGRPDVGASAQAAALHLATMDLQAAQARVEQLRSLPSAADLAEAQAHLTRAKAALAQAQLLAPFDGVISQVHLQPGEWAAPGAPVVEILDTRAWMVETRNVGELAIGDVWVGQAAVVDVLAFGGEALPGHVAAISPVAVVQQGDTTYTLLIALEPTHLPLRPGMNAQVVMSTD